MTQKRLNAAFICHIRQEILDNINIDHLAIEFVERSQIRLNLPTTKGGGHMTPPLQFFPRHFFAGYSGPCDYV